MVLFNKFNKDKTHPVDNMTLFFHEDDYCQVELSPLENIFHFRKESDEINELAEKSFDGSGYTDIFVRNDKRIKLEERKINPEHLEEIIKNIGLDKAAIVSTGYGQTARIQRNDIIGYGSGYKAIYFDIKDGIVGHIWFTNHNNIDKEKLLECLSQIGLKWQLLIVDWNRKIMANLADREAIKKYLDE